ncbi:hypothetical protein ACVNP0_07190 [Staphylococcus aureus]
MVSHSIKSGEFNICTCDYLITGGQPNQLDYDMINDLGFEIDYDTLKIRKTDDV